MERSSFYISHFFGVRPKCLKLWGFRLGESRGIFFAVCSHFLLGGAVEITNCVELCTCKSKLGVVRVPVMNCKHKLIVQKFKMCVRFCICVFLLFCALNILGGPYFSVKKLYRSLLHSVVDQPFCQRKFRETSLHHPLLIISLVLSWWPPTYSFAVVVVWGARIMKRKNGWPSDSPQDVPPYYGASL